MDRLGKRLASAGELSEDDLDLLLDVLTAHQAAAEEVQERIGMLGYRATSRTKTTGVLIDKLRREKSSLKSVQDFAGARIVCERGRSEQDEVVAALTALFSDGARPVKVKDRRAEPSSGYRAVHLVVTVQDLPVEIQVRTWRQDQWAQIVESLGDAWGRGIRYGEAPPDPDRPVMPGAPFTRQELWQSVLGLGELIHEVERLQLMVGPSGPALGPATRKNLEASLHKAEKRLDDAMTLLESIRQHLPD